MYSRRTREEYGDYIITPPPGYDGSRFGNRSDGRDDSFPPYDSQTQIYSQSEKKKESTREKREENKNVSLFPFLKKGIGQEELLLIALLIVLVGEKDVSPEIVIILALLLCI